MTMKIIDILKNKLELLEPNNELYAVLANEHKNLHFKDEIGIGKDLRKLQLAKDAFRIDHEAKTACISNYKKLSELADYYQTGSEALETKPNHQKVAFCLALLYAYAAKKEDQRLRLETLDKLKALCEKNGAYPKDRVVLWLTKHVDTNAHTKEDEEEEKEEHQGRKMTRFLHDTKEKLVQTAHNASHKLQQIIHPHDDEKASTLTPQERQANLELKIFKRNYNGCKKTEKRDLINFFVTEINYPIYTVHGLKALLVYMLNIQKQQIKDTEFRAIRIERNWPHKGQEGNTSSWQTAVSKLKDALMAKLQKKHQEQSILQAEEYDEYAKLFGANTAHFKLFKSMKTPHLVEFERYFIREESPGIKQEEIRQLNRSHAIQ